MANNVALLAEGVDRNPFVESDVSAYRVALLAEGVDRNLNLDITGLQPVPVALLAEGVDRNHVHAHGHGELFGRPPRGGRG